MRVNTLRCFPSAQRHHLLVYASAFCLQSEHCSDGLPCLPVFMFFSSANARSFWGVTAGELCSDGLPCLPVFMVIFSANPQSFWGVTAGEFCSDGLPCLSVFVFFCANARSYWGVTAGEICSDGLPACLYIFFSANARSFWGVAAMDCLPFAFYNLAGVSTATFNDFFLAGTFTAY